MISKMSWTLSFVNAAAEEELKALPADMIARFLRIGDKLASQGLLALREPDVKHLQGKL